MSDEAADIPRRDAAAPPALPEPPLRYGATARWFHWLMALGLLGTFSLGVWVSGLPFSPTRLKAVNWHKWAGIAVLALALLRLGWRLGHAPPPLHSDLRSAIPEWQLGVAAMVVFGMYLLFILVPVLGWAHSSASGIPVVWLGLVPLPELLPVDKLLADELIGPAHALAAWTLAGLVLLHVAAVVKHQWVQRLSFLERMWPPWNRKGSR